LRNKPAHGLIFSIIAAYFLETIQRPAVVLSASSVCSLQSTLLQRCATLESDCGTQARSGHLAAVSRARQTCNQRKVREPHFLRCAASLSGIWKPWNCMLRLHGG
jgi:hypothetical protein